jgi:isoamylase
VGRAGNEFFAVLRARRRRRALPVRRRWRRDASGAERNTAFHWHGYLPGIGPRRRFGYDLVSYNEKHSEANLKDNRDGNDQNWSWNCGVEGPTDDPGILELRARQCRNLMTTLLLSQGVPMITGGDEIARTQGSNNNGWCKDNEISWLDWQNAGHDLRVNIQRLIELRPTEPVFRRSEFLQGNGTDTQGSPTLAGCAPTARR